MSKYSVKKPLTVFVAVVIIFVLGIVSYTSMTPDLMPNINLPYVMITTVYPGASPEKVETEVTKPLEQAMATLDDIDTVSSRSNDNFSLITLQFSESANLDAVTVDILQKINTVSGDWEDIVRTPSILKLNPNMLPVMIAAVDMEGMDMVELSAFVDGTLLNKLEGVTGVASVSAQGLLEEEVTVTLRPEKLDILNERIRKAIDGTIDEKEDELLESKQELEDGLAELQNGKSALNSGKDELLDKTSGVGGTLTEAQANLALAKTLVQAELMILEPLLAEVTDSENQLRELLNAIVELETAEQQLLSAIGSLTTAKSTLEALQPTIDAYNAELAAIQADSSLSEEQKLEEINALNTRYADALYTLAVMEAQLAPYGISFDSGIPGAIAAIDAQLAALNAQLTVVQTTLGDMIVDKSAVSAALDEVSAVRLELEKQIADVKNNLALMESGARSIKDGLAELERGKTNGIITLSENTAKLVAGEAMLESGLKQLETGLDQIADARQDAYDSANAHDVITMEMVSKILTGQNMSMPAGTVSNEMNTYLVTVGDAITSIAELRGLVLFDMGIEGMDPITLLDVADIEVRDNADEIYANINNNPGVLLTFSKQSNYATAEVSDNLADSFAALELQYTGLQFTPLMDQGDYIYIVVNSIISNLLWGAIFAVIVLFLFLRDLRPTLITLCSIPVSVLFAFVLMYFSGVSLNMFSLSGLAVAVGMLVDNSVVVIENIYRLRAKGISSVQAAVAGAKQVGGAIAASTLTTICIFLPIVFIEGLTRDLFTDFALTFGYALLASLVIALTVVPSMSARLLRNVKDKDHKLMDRFLGVYAKLLRWVLDHKVRVLAGVVAMLVLSGILAFARGFSFMPDMDMGQLTVTLEMPEGTELVETAEVSDEAVLRISGIEGVETVGAMVSSGGILSMGGGSGGDETVTMYVLLDGTRSSSAVAEDIAERTADLPAEVSSSSSSGMDISALSGSGITVYLYGEDLETMQSAARAVAAELEKVEGTINVSDGIDDTSPEIHFIVDKNKAAEHGLTVAQVYMEVAAALTSETTSTTITNDGDSYSVLVVNGLEEEMTPGYIKDYILTVTDNAGETKEIALRDIATIVDTETMNSIRREDGLRYVSITAELEEGYNVTLVTRDAEARLADFALPGGMRLEFSGENETIMEAMGELVKMLLLGVLLVYLIMVAQFQSLKSPFIVMFTIPLAFTGGLLALVITGNDVSVISMIGFVMLVGIIVNNGIVLVDYINQLRAEGKETREAIMEAGTTRMRPILMTTITTIFGLLTMAIGVGTGTDIMQPIAVVCIGGLTYATLLTLFVVPAIYELLNRKKKMAVIDESELQDVEE